MTILRATTFPFLYNQNLITKSNFAASAQSELLARLVH
jgi:hypothetical protein